MSVNAGADRKRRGVWGWFWSGCWRSIKVESIGKLSRIEKINSSSTHFWSCSRKNQVWLFTCVFPLLFVGASSLSTAVWLSPQKPSIYSRPAWLKFKKTCWSLDAASQPVHPTSSPLYLTTNLSVLQLVQIWKILDNSLELPSSMPPQLGSSSCLLRCRQWTLHPYFCKSF